MLQVGATEEEEQEPQEEEEEEEAYNTGYEPQFIILGVYYEWNIRVKHGVRLSQFKGQWNPSKSKWMKG
jgi:hypothetical protein